MIVVVRGLVASILIKQRRKFCGPITNGLRGKQGLNRLWRDKRLRHGFNKRTDQRECLLCGLEGQASLRPICTVWSRTRAKCGQLIDNLVICSDRPSDNLIICSDPAAPFMPN